MHSWRHGSWLCLDGEAVERDATAAFKTFAKLAKSLAGRSASSAADVAAALRDEVAAFRPAVPLVQALRNPGMRARHWDALSAALGLDMHLQDSFTLDQAEVRCRHLFCPCFCCGGLHWPALCARRPRTMAPVLQAHATSYLHALPGARPLLLTIECCHTVSYACTPCRRWACLKRGA